MTAQTLEVVNRLDDATYQAKLESLRAYVEQLEGADRQADAGSLQRAADLAAIYEDKRWVEDMPEPKPPQRPGFQIVPDSRKQFFKWAEQHLTSPTTGQALKQDVAKGLLNTEDVLRCVGTRVPTEGVGVKTLKPLVKLVKDGRGDEAPEVWRRATKLADAAGQEVLGQALVRKALAEHNKALGIKPPVSKQTVESYQHKVEHNFDWLIRHHTPEENRALLRRLAERLKAEHQWARGELAS